MRYLSNEWIQAADAAVQQAAHTAPAAPVVVEQHVDGALSYRVEIAQGSCSVSVLGPDSSATNADAVFRQNLATATAVAQGATDAHQAFLLGQITFEGNIDLLIERRDAFAWLEEALAPVLAATTFD